MRQVRIHDVEHITIPMEKPVYLVVTIMGMGMGIGLGMCIGMGMGMGRGGGVGHNFVCPPHQGHTII